MQSLRQTVQRYNRHTLRLTELPPSDVLAIAYLYFKLGMSQLAIARETGRSRTAVRRVVKLFGKAIEAWFRKIEAERGG